MIVYVDDRPLTDTVRDVFTVEGALAPILPVRATQPMANAPSVTGTGVTVGARTVTVGLDVWPDSLPDRVTAMDALARRIGGLRLFRLSDAPTRELYVTLAAPPKVEFYHIAIPRCYVELQFIAVDPTRYERETLPYSLSTTRVAVSLGTVATAPRLYLYGACVDPVVIVSNAAGDETHRLTLTGTLGTNDALVIDGARQWIDRYVAGVLQTGTDSGHAWLTSGQFPLLDPLDGSTLSVALAAGSGTPTGLLLVTRGY